MSKGDMIDVPSSERVSDAEVERFKLERHAEKLFLVELRKAVDSFALRVSPNNRVYGSMVRFLRAYSK